MQAKAVAKQAVLERGMRFMALRSAQRALKPSIRRATTPPGYEVVPRIRDQLKVVGKRVLDERQPPDDLEAELEEIDALLMVMAGELLQALDTVQIPQLRATLPDTHERYPDEVSALLDLCVGTEPGRARRVRTIEYLVTLLASESCEGVRHLVADPTKLSAELRDYCTMQGGALPADKDPTVIAAQFQASAQRAEASEDPSSVVQEIGNLKEDLGEGIFAPAILRAAVEYNISVYNRTEDLLDESRTDDWLEDSELLLSMDVADQDRGPAEQGDDATPAPRGEPVASADGDAGLARIEAAIGAQLRDEAVGDDLAAELIDGLCLGEAERKVFVDADDSEYAAMLRRMVSVGVAYGSLSSHAARAAELGFSTGFLQPEVQRLNEEMRDQTKKLIAEGKYDSARVVSRVKQKFLQGTLLEMTRVAIGQRAAEAGPLPAREKSVEGADEVLGEETKARREKRQKRVKQAKRSAAGVLFVLVLAALGWRLAMIEPLPFDVWTPERLTGLSPHMVSGYRGDSGASQLFIGVVDQRFRTLSVEQQRSEGARIYEGLKPKGVREVLLYDEHRQVRFHWAAGEVRRPAAPEDG